VGSRAPKRFTASVCGGGRFIENNSIFNDIYLCFHRETNSVFIVKFVAFILYFYLTILQPTETLD
jgi:hypothetical protein